MKEKLIDILKNPANKMIAVDLDGTLCEGKFWVEEPTPIQHRIDFVNDLYRKGAHIVIYTARFPKDFEMTDAWLAKFGVLFHGIAMRTKIGADVYIDDKAINASEVDAL